MSFSDDLNKYKARLNRTPKKTADSVKAALLSSVIANTPDNGLVDKGWVDTGNSITNNTPGIAKVEYGGVNQAPAGMVTIAVAQVKQKLKSGSI